MTPKKIAICREKIIPIEKVTRKVAASDFEVLMAVVMWLHFTRDKPMKTTRIAKEQTGMKHTKFPK